MAGENIILSSEELTESIFDTVREPLLVLDQDLRVVKANHSFFDIFKVNAEETIGHLIYDMDNKQWDTPSLKELLENILPQKTQFYDFKVEFDLPVIGRRIMLLNARQIEQEAGLNKIILLAIADITDKQLLQLELEDSEERFRRLFESAREGLLLIEKQKGHIVNANPTICELLSYTKEELIGKQLQEIFFSIDLRDIHTLSEQLLVSGVTLINKITVTSKLGSKIYVDLQLIDRTNFIQCNIQDISKQIESETLHTLDEERLESLLALHVARDLPEQELIKYSLEEAVRLSRSVVGYFHWFDDDKKTFSLSLWSKETLALCAAQKASHYSTENAGIWADCARLREPVIHNEYPNHSDKECLPEGHFPVTRHMSVPLFDTKNKLIAVIGVGNKEDPYDSSDARQLTVFFNSVWDILSLKKNDEEKIQVEAQLQQAQKMEAIGALAGGIAHDFNNILGVILGYADMAMDDSIPGSKSQRDLDKILTAANRAKELVKQILAFSHQTALERIPLKIQPLVKEALKMLRSSLPSTINISENIDPGCGVILADPTQIHQILMNLCTNAFHAMEKTGGNLSVALKTTFIEADDQTISVHVTPGEYIELTVTDTGAGIVPDVIAKIFNPYFTTKSIGKGTGMGLAIIRGILKRYDGTITVDSQLGKGSTFHVYFPVVENDILTEMQEDADLPMGKERILFVDDEELLADTGKDILERLGYHVTVRLSSVDALATFQNTPNKFDMVMTDQTMPDMTGSDLARRMLQIRPDIPIILYTGYSTLIDEKSAKAMGIKEFVLKPITKRVISKLIQKVLDTK